MISRVRRTPGQALGLLILVLIGGVGIWASRRRPFPRSDHPSPEAAAFPLAVCDGKASYAEAVVTGEVRLHRALLPAGVLSTDSLQAAVALQLRYAFAVQQNEPRAPTILTPSGPPRHIEIVAQRNVAYGSDLQLDWVAGRELPPESDYMQRAVARGQVAAADAAVAVAYRAQVGLAVCDQHRGSAEPSEFHFPVPHDPYLLYWHIGKARRITQVHGKKRASTFPCADAEIADYDHPEYLWYFWQPHRRQPDCTQLLQAPRDLGWASVHLGRRVPASGDFTQFRRSFAPPAPKEPDQPLNVVLVFGYLDHQAGRSDPAQLQKCLTASDAVQDADAQCNYHEWGTAQYALFLSQISSVIEVADRVVRPRQDGVVTQLQGRLVRSGRRVALTAYLAETDFLAPPEYTPHHQPLLMEALHQASVLLYVGHSGLGTNFSVMQLQKSIAPAELDAALRNSPVRVLGFVGCYTYTYFGRDFARRIGRAGGLGREAMFVYTGNAVASTAASTLSILSMLDCILQSPDGTIAAGPCSLTPQDDPEAPDFLIYDFAR